MSALRPDAPVVVLLGGTSAEHDVSVRSGTAIADALRAAGPPRPAGPHRPRRRLVVAAGRPCPRRAAPPPRTTTPRRSPRPGRSRPSVAAGLLAASDPPVVVFIALHGPAGEDGTVQGMLDLAGVAYTGSDVTASAIGMDKSVFKRLADEVGLPVVPWTRVHAARWRARPDAVLDDLAACADAWGGERLIVKPAGLGSSLGMTIAHAPDERPAALDAAFAYDPVAIVERCLDHPRELEVSVVGNGPDAIEAYGPGEVLPGREFYDYAAKYLTDDARTFPMADLPPETAAAIRELALAAYRMCGADGFARVDFLLRRHHGVRLGDQHDPRLHRDQPLPADVRRRRDRDARALRPDRPARRGARARPAGPPPHARRPPAMIVRRSRSDPRRRGRVRARPAPTVRRASARRRFSPRRALAALAMLGAAIAFYGLAASPAFGVRAVTTSGATLTGDAAVVAALALPTAPADLPVDDSAGTTGRRPRPGPRRRTSSRSTRRRWRRASRPSRRSRPSGSPPRSRTSSPSS